MENTFEIEGYWKDNKEEFNSYLVKSSEYSGEEDESIFFFGLSEEDVKKEIELGEDTEKDFVITGYTKIN